MDSKPLRPTSSPTCRPADDGHRPLAFVFSTLAIYQSEFWIAVSKRLAGLGHDVAIIAFDDRSAEMVEGEGVQCFNAAQAWREARREDRPNTETLEKTFRRYGIQDASGLLTHERAAFEIDDETTIAHRLSVYLGAVDYALEILGKTGKRLLLVQETGGFVSVLAGYWAARARGLDTWFIEPSFFRGRLFFVRNSLAAPAIHGPGARCPSQELRTYIETTTANQALVIPQKDRHQYRPAVAKVLNSRNVGRLIAKLVDKHLLGKHQEFGHIGQHVRRHLTMLTTSWRLAKFYSALADLDRFIYYPLQVPADMALTIRSPEYLDQLSLIGYLAETAPEGCTLAIKEHPAQIGGVDFSRLRTLLKRHANLFLLPPTTNNYAVLKAADVVVSVNSKSGAEALLIGTPVLVLGDAFYRYSGLAQPIDHLTDLPGLLARLLADPPALNSVEVTRYFQAVWDRSYAGELYIKEASNVATFVDSLLAAFVHPRTVGVHDRTESLE